MLYFFDNYYSVFAEIKLLQRPMKRRAFSADFIEPYFLKL